MLTERQLQALERQKSNKEAYGELATVHPGYLGCQDTYYVGNSYSWLAEVKLYQEETSLTSADMLNDRVLPWYQEQRVPILRILTDRGSEYKGKLESHAYELFLSLEGIVHTTTKAYSPQTNGMCERFNRTMQEEFFDTAMRKRLYTDLGSLQEDLDAWLGYYNKERPHSGKYCYGKTPMQTFEDSKSIALEQNNELLSLKETTDKHYLTDIETS